MNIQVENSLRIFSVYVAVLLNFLSSLHSAAQLRSIRALPELFHVLSLVCDVTEIYLQ